MKNSKPYKYSSKDRLEKTPAKKKKKKKEVVSENTIKIDELRLNDSESLDTSFLEGRIEKKVANNKKAKEKILQDNTETLKKIRLLRKIFLTLSFICIILLIALYSADSIKTSLRDFNRNRVNKELKEESKIDSNYLFIGDFYTFEFDFNKFGLDYHYVNNSSYEMKPIDVLNNMKKMIYDYNPSHVFIQFSMQNSDFNQEEYLKQIESMIYQIKMNRPYALIYIESVYPIGRDYSRTITNEKVRSFNTMLSNLCENKGVQYLDLYSVLENNGELNQQYSDDGVHLNLEGYQQINQIIQKIVG